MSRASRLWRLRDRGHRRNQPRAVRLSRGGAGARRRLPHRIQQHGIRHVLHGRIHQHDHGVGRGDEPVSRRLAWTVPAAGIRLDLVPRSSWRAAVLLFVAALDAAAVPLRPVDGVRLEGAAAGRDGQPHRRRRRGCSTLGSEQLAFLRVCRASRCSGRCSSSSSAIRSTASWRSSARSSACRVSTCCSTRRLWRLCRSSSTPAPSWCCSCSWSCCSTCRVRTPPSGIARIRSTGRGRGASAALLALLLVGQLGWALSRTPGIWRRRRRSRPRASLTSASSAASSSPITCLRSK